jgi:eukaryotic-like serine/threonine-protein kinase
LTRGEIWVLPAAGDRKPRVLIQSAGPAYDGHFSPDGHWVVYASKESGREEVYVVPFDAARVLSTPPGQRVSVGAKFQVSPNGGAMPKWRRDGKEIFYVQHADEFVATRFEEHALAPSIGETRLLFRKRTYPSGARYDVSADGQRLIVNSIPDTARVSLTLVTSWPELLRNK